MTASAGMHALEVKLLDVRFGCEWPLPAYATPSSAALDLRASIEAPLTLAPGKTQVRAVEGSKVEIEGVATKPLKSAAIFFSDIKRAPADLDGPRGMFSYDFPVKESTPFWLQMVDTEGFVSRDPVKPRA